MDLTTVKACAFPYFFLLLKTMVTDFCDTEAEHKNCMTYFRIRLHCVQRQLTMDGRKHPELLPIETVCRLERCWNFCSVIISAWRAEFQSQLRMYWSAGTFTLFSVFPLCIQA